MSSAIAQLNKSQAQRLMMLMRNLRYRTTPAAMMVLSPPFNLYALLGAAGGRRAVENERMEDKVVCSLRRKLYDHHSRGKIVEHNPVRSSNWSR